MLFVPKYVTVSTHFTKVHSLDWKNRFYDKQQFVMSAKVDEGETYPTVPKVLFHAVRY